MADTGSESEGTSFLDLPCVDVVDTEMADLTSGPSSSSAVGSSTFASPKPGPSKTPIRSVPKGSGLVFYMEDEASESDTERWVEVVVEQLVKIQRELMRFLEKFLFRVFKSVNQVVLSYELL